MFVPFVACGAQSFLVFIAMPIESYLIRRNLKDLNKIAPNDEVDG